MPIDWKNILAEQGPKLALSLLAAKQGGPHAQAALMEGIAARQEHERQIARQTQLDQQQQQYQQAQIGNLNADNARADEQARLQKLHETLAMIQGLYQTQAETATNPDVAQAAVNQGVQSAANLAHVNPTDLQRLTPPIAPVISARKKKRAEDLYTRAEKRFGPEAMAADSITIQGGEEFGDLKPSQLRALFEAPAVTATGEAAQPYIKPAPQPAPTTERLALAAYAKDRGKTPDQLSEKDILDFRRTYSAADNTPNANTEPILPDDVQGAGEAILAQRMAPSQLSLVGGMGARGVKFKQAVVAYVNKKNPSFNWQQAEAGFQYGKNTGTQTTVRYIDQIARSLPVLEQASADFKRSGVRVINKALIASGKQFGNTDVVKFDFARTLVADEIAKVLQGGGTGNGTSDAKLRQAQDLLAGDMTPEQLTAALSTAKELLASRRETLTEGTFLQGPKAPATAPIKVGKYTVTPK